MRILLPRHPTEPPHAPVLTAGSAALRLAALLTILCAACDTGGDAGPSVVVGGPGAAVPVSDAGGGGSDVSAPGGIGAPDAAGPVTTAPGAPGTVVWESPAMANEPAHPPVLLPNGAIAVVDGAWQLQRFTANGAFSGDYDLTLGLGAAAAHASAPVVGPDGIVVGMGWADLPACAQGGALLPVPFAAGTAPALDGTAQILEPPAVDGASLVWASVLFKLNKYEGLCTKGPPEAAQLSRTDAIAAVASPTRGVSVAQDGSLRAVVAPNILKGYTDTLLETFSVSTDGTTISDPAIGAGGVTYVTNGRHVVAVTPTGVVAWDALVPIEVSTLTGQPAVTPSGLVVAPGTAIGQTASLNRPAAAALDADGTVAWIFVAPGGDASQPNGVTCGTPVVAADERIFLACGDGRVYGLSAAGAVEWSKDVGALALSPVLTTGGALVVAGRTRVTALATGTSGLASGPWARYRANNGSTGHAASNP